MFGTGTTYTKSPFISKIGYEGEKVRPKRETSSKGKKRNNSKKSQMANNSFFSPKQVMYPAKKLYQGPKHNTT